MFLTKGASPELSALIERINDSYEYWSDVKYRSLVEGVGTSEKLWTLVKASRLSKMQVVWPKYRIMLSVTNNMQRMCHEFDMNFGGSWGTNSIIPENNKERYLISSLMEEAISSSQMEGASTTRKLAKEMLRKGVNPRDKSQQMIHNNYQTIRFIVENKNNALTSDLLRQIHALMTNKTLDNAEDEGRYRTDNSVVVEDGITHETVHTPPSFEEIPEFIDTLCDFFNQENSTSFIHPIIKGIIIHFMIAYVHPFADGNGRTARALFYWYMLKQGYWLTEYMSISRIISRSKKSYEKAYLYTEADGNDIGYFVAYNLRILKSAFTELQLYIKRKIIQDNNSSNYLRLGNINQREAGIIALFVESPNSVLTIKELQNRFSVTHTTAKSDVDSLIERGLLAEIALNRVKRGYIKSNRFDEIISSTC